MYFKVVYLWLSQTKESLSLLFELLNRECSIKNDDINFEVESFNQFNFIGYIEYKKTNMSV